MARAASGLIYDVVFQTVGQPLGDSHSDVQWVQLWALLPTLAFEPSGTRLPRASESNRKSLQ